jgi:hypothetical protein
VNDSSIARTNLASPLCRVYYSQITSSQICIQSIQDIVSDVYQALIPVIEGPCFSPTSTEQLNNLAFTVQVQPNPMKNQSIFQFQGLIDGDINIQLFDALGRMVISEHIQQSTYLLERKDLGAGVYYFKVQNGNQQQSGKLIIE